MASQDPSYTESLTRLIDRFCTLPGIGRRTAERLAFHILKSDPQQALALAAAIEEVKKNVRHCSVCYNLTEADYRGDRFADYHMDIKGNNDILSMCCWGIWRRWKGWSRRT